MARAQRPKRSTQQGIQSIEVGADLLQVLSDAAGPVALKELAMRANMSPSKAHKYLVSLARCGMTRQDRVSGYYDLGPLALKMGLAALNRRDAVRLVAEAAIDFNQRHDLTVMVTIWTPRGPIVIALHNSSQLVVGNVSVGAILPVLRSASGRAFLAYLAPNMTRAIVAREMRVAAQRKGAGALSGERDVERLIQRVWSLKAGWTKDDLVIGLNALAAPVFDHQGAIVASLTVLDNTDAVDVDSPRSILPELLRVTDGVSRQLGFEPGNGLPLALRARSAEHRKGPS
ncbi:MAG: helix-turn-helix domain-containing protein [Rhodospirillales bacterium]|nr:helix-turn-helix domain-containing protein [Rhodospirillales bacterium]